MLCFMRPTDDLGHTDVSPIGQKSHKVIQKKLKRSYAAVVREGPRSKKRPKSNHLAYAAWQERRVYRQPKDESKIATKGAMAWATPEVDDFILVTPRKWAPKIHPINRVAAA